LDLNWTKSANGEWFDLDSAIRAAGGRGWGVYVIWTPSDKPQRPATVLKVGSGNIATRLHIERSDPDLRWLGDVRLLVTWAAVEDPSHRQGIARYLSEQLVPFFHRIAEPLEPAPVPVNLPLIA
jgi:hypothetical protein